MVDRAQKEQWAAIDKERSAKRAGNDELNIVQSDGRRRTMSAEI
jgi:hypothetical protein